MMNALIFLCLIPHLIEGQKYVQHTDIDVSKSGTSGIITSPGYPANYPNNVVYTWTLKTGNPKATVAWNISEFDVQKYPLIVQCEDYLQIKRTEPCCMLIMNRCGTLSSFISENTGMTFTVTFVSNDMKNARGFMVSWRVYTPDTTPCTTTTTTTEPVTTSTKTTTKPTTVEPTTTTTKPTTTVELTTTTTKRTTTKPSTTIPTTTTTTEPMTTTTKTTTNDTEANVENRKAYTTIKERETLFTTIDSIKKTPTWISTQRTTAGNDVSETLETKEIIYIVAGIAVVELTLVALGTYIVKQRRAKTRHLNTGKPDKEKNRPVSRKSVASVGNIYESIPMEHFSIKDAMPEDDESVYTEVPEHTYDKTFEHRPHVKVNANLYQLISELKTKNR